MDLTGLLVMLLGVGVLLCMRDYASVEREFQPWLFRLNFRGFLGGFREFLMAGEPSRRMAFVMGTLVGVAAIVGGAIIAFG